jgi:hypothetical protein
MREMPISQKDLIIHPRDGAITTENSRSSTSVLERETMASKTKEDEMNAKMVKVAPELASSYARYPLNGSRWLMPKEKGPKGEPCFIASPTDTGLKPDYVYGSGRGGKGYYHLLTRDAYNILHPRVAGQAPSGCCACSAESRKEVDDHDDVRRLMYNRQMATIPNDAVGASDGLAAAQQTAQDSLQYDQNVQTGIGIMQTAANFSG